MNIQKTINFCLSLDYKNLKEFASQNYQKLYNFLKEKQSIERLNVVLSGSIFTCVSADGKVTDEEIKFIKDFVGEYSYESLTKMVDEYYAYDAQESIRMLYSVLNDEMKKVLTNLCVAVLTVDKDFDFCENFLLSLMTYEETF